MALTPEQIQQLRQQYKIGHKEQPQGSTVGSLLGIAKDLTVGAAKGLGAGIQPLLDPRGGLVGRTAMMQDQALNAQAEKAYEFNKQATGLTDQNITPANTTQTVGSFIPAALPLAGMGAKAAVKAVAPVVKEALAGTRGAVGGAIESTGQKIQTTALKPSAKDMKDGFKIENLTKYNVGGSPQEILAKSQIELNKRAQAIKTLAGDSDAYIDMNNVYENAFKSLTTNKTKSFGDNASITSVLQKLKSEIDNVAPDGAVSFSDALDIRRSASNKGAWAYNRPDPDAGAIEEVYTAFYQELKKEMDSVAPEGFRELNKQISDLIPVQNAAMRRVPVDERNNALGLLETIGLAATVYDPSALMLTVTARATKSGRVGNALTKAGQAIKGEVPSTGIKSSKTSTVTNTSTSKGLTERGGVSAQKTNTSGGFDGGTIAKRNEDYARVEGASLDPKTIKLSGDASEKTSAKRAANMSDPENNSPVTLKVNKDGSLQVVDGNARVTAFKNQGKPITTYILDVKKSDAAAIESLFPKQSKPSTAISGSMKDVPKELAPLYEEAKKYKTAEEFSQALNGQTIDLPTSFVRQFVRSRGGRSFGEQMSSLEKNGFDRNQPIQLMILKDGTATLGDGNGRTLAASQLGMEKVPVRVTVSNFTSKDISMESKPFDLTDIWNKANKKP